jgi:hypothetical protein
MSGTHLSEESLQQYVLDRAACTQEEIGHFDACPDCQAAVAAYGVLGDVLKAQPAPAFDFDLTAAVIARLEAPPRKIHQEGAVLTALLIGLVIGVPAWLFRKSAYYVFTDMSADFYWVVLAAAGIVIGLFLLRLYKKYQDVINLINK